jgi:hypothetical protein
MEKVNDFELKKVSPQSNNVYKSAAPLGTIQVSFKGGAFSYAKTKINNRPRFTPR